MGDSAERRFRPETTRNTHDGVVISAVVRLHDENDRCAYVLALNRDEFAALEHERARVPLIFGAWDWYTLREADEQVRQVIGYGFHPR